jgi:Trypsin/Putative Ig domain
MQGGLRRCASAIARRDRYPLWTWAVVVSLLSALLTGGSLIGEAPTASAIENGQPASAPWTAELTFGYPLYIRDEFCTGSLIAPQWVLTAGHCFSEFPNQLLWFDRVLVNKVSYSISEAVPEPFFGYVRSDATVPIYDAELLKLSTPVPNASPIALAPPQPDYSPLVPAQGSPGAPTIDAYGDGPTSQNNSSSAAMRMTKPNSYTIQGICKPPYPQTDWCFKWNTGGSEIIPGDSGGPWVVEPGAQLPDQGTLSPNPMQLAVQSAGPPVYVPGRAEVNATDLTNNIIYDWASETAGTYLAPNGNNCVYNKQTECIVQFPNGGGDYLVGPTSGTGTIGAGFGHLIDSSCFTPLLNTLPGILPAGTTPLAVPTVDASQSDEIPLDSTHALCITTTPGALADGTVGTAYDTTLEADGGTMPYTWAVTSGSLPDGLSLDPSTGEITGTPTSAGPSTFEVTATDNAGATTTATFDLDINSAGLGAWLGTWTGPVSQTPSPGFSYDVTISLTSNSGPVVGTDYYSTFNCTGELTLVSVTPQTLVLQETITAQGSSYTCIDGEITLTATGTGTAEYDWTGGGYTATAPLTQEDAP